MPHSPLRGGGGVYEPGPPAFRTEFPVPTDAHMETFLDYHHSYDGNCRESFFGAIHLRLQIRIILSDYIEQFSGSDPFMNRKRMSGGFNQFQQLRKNTSEVFSNIAY